jgi:hypothetical protein
LIVAIAVGKEWDALEDRFFGFGFSRQGSKALADPKDSSRKIPDFRDKD